MEIPTTPLKKEGYFSDTPLLKGALLRDGELKCKESVKSAGGHPKN